MKEITRNLRTCSKCKVTTDESEFYKGSPKSNWCKTCHGQYVQKWSKENVEKIKAIKHRSCVTYYLTPRGRAKHILCGMKWRSKRLGLPVEFSRDEIEEIITTRVCAKTSIPFVLTRDPSSKTNPFSPSPDRIDPSLGYTKENTQWVCWIYNAMKGDFEPEAVEKFILALSPKHQPQVTQ